MKKLLSMLLILAMVFCMGKLYCTMGIMFILLEVPLLSGHNSAWILVSAGGVMIEVIVAMIVYITVIEKKYKKK